MRTTIGEFLLTRLTQAGISEVIGVPGDFNLNLIEQIDRADGIRFVGTCNELNAAYAADGYARSRGVSALLTTYGVGELSALNGIAGAAAEHVPVVSVAGSPPLYATEYHWDLHHTMADGDFSNMLASIGQFTATAVRVTPANAVEEIDRALRTCLREKRPVHIQVPSDITHLTIDAPDTPLDLSLPSSDPERLESAVRAVLDRFAAAQRPVILVDQDADRHRFGPLLQRLAEKTGIPYAQLPSGRSILEERNPLFLGTYNGAASAPAVRAAVEDADVLVTTTPRFIETNSGSFTQKLDPSVAVDVGDQHVSVGGDEYVAITGVGFLEELVDRVPAAAAESDEASVPVPEPVHASVPVEPDRPLSQERLWPRFAQFFAPGDVIVAEAGTSNIGLGSQPLPNGVRYINSGIWGAIGFTLPAVLGSQLAAPDRRHLLFIGDGSFQMTAQELSTILHQDLTPVIVLVNNRGYTIERYILGMEARYNDIADWRYADLPRLFRPDTTMVSHHASTEGELEGALAAIAADPSRGAFLELHLDPEDAPAGLRVFGPATAEFDYGPRGPRNAPRNI